MTEHRYRALIEETRSKIETALGELAEKVDAAVRQEVAQTLIQAISVPAGAGKTVALAAAAGVAHDQIAKTKRAPWGASRIVILETFKRAGGGYSDLGGFRLTAERMGYDLALSSIRSMALDMEKAGELGRVNGKWYLISEKGAAVPNPSEEDTAVSTPESAVNSGSLVSG